MLQLEKIATFAKENSVSIIFVAGDIFDAHTPDNYARTAFYKWVNKLNPIKVVTLVGTHDNNAKDVHALSPLKELNLKNLVVLDSVGYTTVDDIGVVSVPHLSKYLTPEILSEINKAVELAKLDFTRKYKIVLGHFSVAGAKVSDTYSIKSLDDFVVPLEIFKDVIHYVALGHIHKSQAINECTVTAYYSGSVEHVNYGEVSNKLGFWHNCEGAITWIPMEGRPMFVLDLSTASKACNEIPPNSLVKLTVSTQSLEMLSSIRAVLAAKGCTIKVEAVRTEAKKRDATVTNAPEKTWQDLLRENIARAEAGYDKAYLLEKFNQLLERNN
jgi:DNA repair exonuclease SbcCD nuclease subunit